MLTDFDHMAEIVTNLQSSKVLSRSTTTLVVAQQGRTSAGPLTFAFETVREVELKPFYEIRARLLHGSAKAGRNNSSHRGINRDSNRESW